MNAIKRIQSILKTGADIARRSTARLFGLSEGVWSAISRVGIRGGGVLAASGVIVSAETAMLVSAYKRGVELLAHHVAKTQFSVKCGAQCDTTHAASSLIRWWARHHQMSAFEFRRTMMVIALTRGNAYAYIVRERSVPVELLLLDGSQVQPELIAGHLWYRVAGRRDLISSSDMIHIKGLGVNGYEGLDPIRYYAKEVLGLAIATQNYAATYYENGGTPAAYLKSEIPLDDEKFNRLKGEAGPLKRSVNNPHELPVLEQTDIKAVGLTAEQTQLLTARKDSILDIANLIGIPPHKLGLAISTSYGSLEEENEAFRDDSLDPWLTQFESEFRKLLTEDEQATESHSIEADRSDFNRMKSADKAEYLSKLTGGAAIITVDDGRAMMGLGPVDGGDKLLIPWNMRRAGETETDDDAETEVDVETETDDDAETEVETDDAETETLQRYRQQALADVYRRMAKRITTAAGRLRTFDQLHEFETVLETNHLPVIISALEPIVPLCMAGGDVAALARQLVTDFVTRLQPLEQRDDFKAGLVRLCDEYPETASQLAGVVLRKAA